MNNNADIFRGEGGDFLDFKQNNILKLAISKLEGVAEQLMRKSNIQKRKNTHLSTQLIILFICFTTIPLVLNSFVILNRTQKTTRETLHEYSQVIIEQGNLV